MGSKPVLVLTQALAGAKAWTALEPAGVTFRHWPLTRIDPVAPATLAAVLQRLPEHDWVFLASPSAVAELAAQMQAAGRGWPAGVRAALPGPGTVAMFRQCFGPDVPIDSPPGPPHDAAHLVASLVLPPTRPERGLRALILRREDGRTAWIEALQARGVTPHWATLYAATALPPPETALDEWRSWCRAGRRVAFTLGAASQLEPLHAWLEGIDPGERARILQAHWYVPHEAVGTAAHNKGHRQVVVYRLRQDVLCALQSGAPRVVRAPLRRGPGASDEHDPHRKPEP